MGATGGYRAPRAGLLLRHPVQGDRPSDAVLDDRRALDRSNQTHSYVKDVQGQNVRHVLGLDILRVRVLTFPLQRRGGWRRGTVLESRRGLSFDSGFAFGCRTLRF